MTSFHNNVNAPSGYIPLPNMSLQIDHDVPETYISRTKRRVLSGFRISIHHFKKHVGVGIICSVAYFDPYVNHLNAEDGF